MPERDRAAAHAAPPKPGDTLCDEGGSAILWLAAAWTKEEVCEECHWLDLTPKDLHMTWMCCRWTTSEELADEDWVYDNFGDVEMNCIDTSVVYWPAKAKTLGAHLYWTTESPGVGNIDGINNGGGLG